MLMSEPNRRGRMRHRHILCTEVAYGVEWILRQEVALLVVRDVAQVLLHRWRASLPPTECGSRQYQQHGRNDSKREVARKPRCAILPPRVIQLHVDMQVAGHTSKPILHSAGTAYDLPNYIAALSNPHLARPPRGKGGCSNKQSDRRKFRRRDSHCLGLQIGERVGEEGRTPHPAPMPQTRAGVPAYRGR